MGAATLAAFAGALALPLGAARPSAAAAVAVELAPAFTPYGERRLEGTVPAIADRLELTIDGELQIVSLADEGRLEGERRRLDLPMPGSGRWQAAVYWAEHRLGTAEGGRDPSSAARDTWPYDQG